MASTPRKPKMTERKTAQTGLMEGLDYDPTIVTPKKGENYDEENAKPIDISEPTKEEADIAARQEQFRKAILTAKGGKKKRRSTKKVKKIKKHRKH